MNVKGNIADLFADADLELTAVSEGAARIMPIPDICDGQEMITVLVTLDDEAQFRTYSTSSPASLRAYGKGFLHALSLVNGGYAFKPNNEAAARRKRGSVCPWKEAARKYRFQQTASEISAASPGPRSFGQQVIESIAEMAKATRTPGAKALLSPRFAHWRNRFRDY